LEEAVTSLQQSWTEVGPWGMHALVGGPAGGTPLLLVHGYGVSCRYWRPLAARLARTCRVAAPDLPGHGRSSTPAGPALDVRQLADALSRWMQASGAEPAVLVGNSLGCQIAAELALREPARVRGVVFCGPTVDPAARSVIALGGRVGLSAPVEDPRLAPIVAADYLRMGLGRLRAELGHMLAHRIETLLPRIAAPALVLRGRWDRVAPHPWARRVADLLPQGALAEIPWGGHAVHFSRPRAVARVLLEWLER
jgi:pimeloyl-ACP methyl ester carboxylesterase